MEPQNWNPYDSSRRISDEVFGQLFVEIFDLTEDVVTTVKLVGLGTGKILYNLQNRVSKVSIRRKQFEFFDDMGVEVWKQELFT